MLEKMGDFFDNRLEGYDEHQLNGIDCAREFLAFTANCLPAFPKCSILDLGCGTGLELEFYFAINPSAEVTGIDLAPGMLGKLKEKFSDRAVHLVCGSYFDVSFEPAHYDAAVSVESLHHFTAEEKLPLYQKLRKSIKPGGYFILTDYFALSDDDEIRYRNELVRLKGEQGITDTACYHCDTPLTVEHERQCLEQAGFAKIEVLHRWGATHTLKAAE